ncbi:hypothetical protein SAMN05428969_2834 [Devosia sp. YR412]|uniref:hypothetical protein n=1 Tax=Devosia sp. YR412 TaxID=1881030 RepID=UPI0008ABBB18|nr:hypothetical protein [Devosia sp. YR412]SEQ37981.1 hypothetical protein SAMN05428969_2834 [Devosia sp. YR412]
MRKSAAAEIVARRLAVARGRTDSLVQRASEADLLPTSEGSRRYPPDLGAIELTNLFLAVVTDRGLANASQSVREFAALENEHGKRFGDALTDMFSHGPALASAVTGNLVLRLEPPSVSMTLGGTHVRYGPEPPTDSAGKHVIVPGRTLAAIGLEFSGHSPHNANTIVALASASRSLDLSAAFSSPGSA